MQQLTLSCRRQAGNFVMQLELNAKAAAEGVEHAAAMEEEAQIAATVAADKEAATSVMADAEHVTMNTAEAENAAADEAVIEAPALRVEPEAAFTSPGSDAAQMGLDAGNYEEMHEVFEASEGETMQPSEVDEGRDQLPGNACEEVPSPSMGLDSR